MQGAKTVDQAIAVLLALEERALSASEISESTGLNRTVVHRMLASLHENGFVRREHWEPGTELAVRGGHAVTVARVASWPLA